MRGVSSGSMKDIQKLIALLELTREQPQYGYLTVGVPLHETSNLAEHHFLVTWIGLLLSKLINQQGPKVNEQRVVELCLMHDLGELFGGDVCAPLSRKYPELKKAAQQMEDRNFQFLVSKARTAGLDLWLEGLWKEEGERQSLEAVIAKIADLMETCYFLEHRSRHAVHASKEGFFEKYIRPLGEKISDPEVRAQVEKFFDSYLEVIHGKQFQVEKFLLEE